MKLDGKVAIVSAAGRGIGRAITLCLAEEGADLVVNSFREETTAGTVGAVEALGRKALGISGDAASPDIIARIIQETLDAFGKIDILANNVGGGPPQPTEPGGGPFADVSASWDGTYEQNLRAPVLMCEAVAPHFMDRNSGKIVNIGSVAGRAAPSVKVLTSVSSPAYGAMKAGLVHYTQTLSQRLGPHNVNVNCVCPGIVPTDAWEKTSERVVQSIPEYKGMDPDEWFHGVVRGKYPDMFRSVPLRREQTVEDIARTVLFLVSEDGKNITGQTVNVDGGMTKN